MLTSSSISCTCVQLQYSAVHVALCAPAVLVRGCARAWTINVHFSSFVFRKALVLSGCPIFVFYAVNFPSVSQASHNYKSYLYQMIRHALSAFWWVTLRGHLNLIKGNSSLSSMTPTCTLWPLCVVQFLAQRECMHMPIIQRFSHTMSVSTCMNRYASISRCAQPYNLRLGLM